MARLYLSYAYILKKSVLQIMALCIYCVHATDVESMVGTAPSSSRIKLSVDFPRKSIEKTQKYSTNANSCCTCRSTEYDSSIGDVDCFVRPHRTLDVDELASSSSRHMVHISCLLKWLEESTDNYAKAEYSCPKCHESISSDCFIVSFIEDFWSILDRRDPEKAAKRILCWLVQMQNNTVLLEFLTEHLIIRLSSALMEALELLTRYDFMMKEFNSMLETHGYLLPFHPKVIFIPHSSITDTLEHKSTREEDEFVRRVADRSTDELVVLFQTYKTARNEAFNGILQQILSYKLISSGISSDDAKMLVTGDILEQTFYLGMKKFELLFRKGLFATEILKARYASTYKAVLDAENGDSKKRTVAEKFPEFTVVELKAMIPVVYFMINIENPAANSLTISYDASRRMYKAIESLKRHIAVIIEWGIEADILKMYVYENCLKTIYAKTPGAQRRVKTMRAKAASASNEFLEELIAKTSTRTFFMLLNEFLHSQLFLTPFPQHLTSLADMFYAKLLTYVDADIYYFHYIELFARNGYFGVRPKETEVLLKRVIQRWRSTEGERDIAIKYLRLVISAMGRDSLEKQSTGFLREISLISHKLGYKSVFKRVDTILEDRIWPFCLSVNIFGRRKKFFSKNVMG